MCNIVRKDKKDSIPFLVMDEILSLLEHRGICRLILFLHFHPEGIVRIRYREPPINLNPRAAKKYHDLLFNAGIIENVPNNEKFLFRLSAKGMEIAAFLLAIQDLLK
jgi:predicted transcriptional regulator